MHGLTKQGNETKKQDGVKTCDNTNDNNKRKKDRDPAKITLIEMFIYTVSGLSFMILSLARYSREVSS